MIRTGTLCVSYLYKYFTTSEDDTEANNTEDDSDGLATFNKKKFKLKCLSEVFAESGGVLSKISQILNMDMGNHENSVFSDCKPHNPEKTIDFIKEELSKEQYKDKIIDFDFNIYKSGSIGQVHKAKDINGNDIVIKVQYSGLYEQFNIDFNILKNVAQFFLGRNEISDLLKKIEHVLYDELNYVLEVKNHNEIYDLWKDNEFIKISEVVNDLCSEKIITLKCIDGESLTDFINNSTQEEKNFIASKIFEFIFTNLFKYKLFYSDIHYGNFLVQNKNILYVMDFGCLTKIDDELLHNLKLIYKSLHDEDYELFYAIVEDLNIITDEIITDEETKFVLDRFKLMLKPLLYKGNFVFNKEWYMDDLKYSKKLEKWGLSGDLVHFSKIQFGLFSMFVDMNISFNAYEIFTKIIKDN
jgi:predicted unusual protein kinase regulating ubiquinone biosynthesis (AarF/ABC1/UbiB family)